MARHQARNLGRAVATQRKNSCRAKEVAGSPISANGSERPARNEKCELIPQAFEGVSDCYQPTNRRLDSQDLCASPSPRNGGISAECNSAINQPYSTPAVHHHAEQLGALLSRAERIAYANRCPDFLGPWEQTGVRHSLWAIRGFDEDGDFSHFFFFSRRAAITSGEDGRRDAI
jgi:hypothetical protein